MLEPLTLPACHSGAAFEGLCIHFGIFRYKQYNSGGELIPALSDSS